ncbi:cold shock domain-containing protein [Polymorphospora rubra]|uniref:cold-shock protein n=1 Tax=Polymorphospora rubra TaxID=338584 RepID=UPI0033C3FFA3
MAVGKVLRFDETRGYGFIAPDAGGEDVFLHANDLRDEKYLIRPGVAVEFDLEEGERGLKASSVRVLDRTPRRPAVTKTVEARFAGKTATGEDDDGLCDVLSGDEFRNELTELLIDEVPSLTGSQIALIRQRITRLAQTHGWVES